MIKRLRQKQSFQRKCFVSNFYFKNKTKKTEIKRKYESNIQKVAKWKGKNLQLINVLACNQKMFRCARKFKNATKDEFRFWFETN